jgi:Protein of unknown function (DUF2796)
MMNGEISIMKRNSPNGFIRFFNLLFMSSRLLLSIAAGRQITIRCLLVSLVVALVVLPFGFIGDKIQAGEYRHHEAHVHGIARMNVAVEEDQLYIEFITPAANIVGFEHSPNTSEQKTAVQKAIETLKTGRKLFSLPPGAEGRLVESKVETDIIQDSHHESESAYTHEPGDMHREVQEDTHHHEEDHKSEAHEHHSDFKSNYRFVCKNPEGLGYIDVRLFRIFPGIERIEVQLLTITKQTGQDLTSKENRIVF